MQTVHWVLGWVSVKCVPNSSNVFTRSFKGVGAGAALDQMRLWKGETELTSNDYANIHSTSEEAKEETKRMKGGIADKTTGITQNSLLFLPTDARAIRSVLCDSSSLSFSPTHSAGSHPASLNSLLFRPVFPTNPYKRLFIVWVLSLKDIIDVHPTYGTDTKNHFSTTSGLRALKPFDDSLGVLHWSRGTTILKDAGTSIKAWGRT